MTYKMKKYAYGGYDPNSTEGKIQGYASGANFAGQFLQTIAPDSAIGEIGGGALSGAGTGAAAGLAFGPVGAVVGGALGLVGGAIGGIASGNKKRQALQQQALARQKQMSIMQGNYDRETNDRYDAYGSNQQGYYALGGSLTTETTAPPTYRDIIMNPNMGMQPYSPTNPFLVEKKNGSIGQWGNPLQDSVAVPIPVQSGNKQPAYYNPTTYQNMGQVGLNLPRGTAIPTQYKSANFGSHYARGGYISSYHSGNVIDRNGNSYANGGTIHIDPSHKGDFTAYLKRTGKTAHEALSSSDPHVRKMAQFAINIGHTKMAEGGTLPLASDTQKFIGPSHEQGGIQIGGNAEVEGDEVQRGNQIYSDQLKPSAELMNLLEQNKISTNGTYADIATKLGRMKGKYETKLLTHSPISLRTGKVMHDRVESLMDATFQDQEMSKQFEEQSREFALGGELGDPEPKTPKSKQQLDYEKYLLDKYYSVRRGDPETAPTVYDNMKGKFVPRVAPPIPTGMMESKDKEGNYTLVPASNTPTGSTTSLSRYVTPLDAWDTPQTWNPLAVRKPVVIGDMSQGRASQSIAPSTNNVTNTALVRKAPQPYTGRRVGISGSSPTTRGAMLPIASSVGTETIPVASNIPNVNFPTSPTLPDNTQIPPTRGSTLSRVGNAIDEYGADVMNVASYFGNQSAINGMKAPEFSLARAPRYNYSDRSALPKYENAVAAKGAMRGVTNTSAQGRSAEKATIFAQQLSGNNQINQQEAQRKDAYDNAYENRALQTDYANTEIMNKQTDISTQVNNEKIGLGIQNRNTLNQGIVGNQAVRNQENLDTTKALTILASTPDPDKALNLLSKFMSPEMAKRLQQLYKRK